MSAATERVRRVTAGRRMSDLVGKAAEDDDAFWSNDVWAEDDSGNDSFHESDEDPDQRVDRFDSDFDDSETDNEADELAAGEAEEEELQREERSSRKNKYVDIAKAGRDLLQKKKGSSRKRKKDLMGDGFNAGLMLNLPPATGVAPPLLQAPTATVTQMKTAKPASPSKPIATLAATRSRRSTRAGGRRQLRAGTRHKTTTVAAKARQTATNSSQQPKKPQRKFTQEELLLEAATVTEPENERWLLGRKRVQDLENLVANKDASMQREVRGKVLFKFHSRRGCFNTLTFPEMDAVPAILAKRHMKPKRPKKQVCVITGKQARYRDPKTNKGYHDLAAYKELRRRLKAGEELDQRKVEVSQAEKDEGISPDVEKNDASKEEHCFVVVTSNNSEKQLKKAERAESTDARIEPKTPKPPASNSIAATVQTLQGNEISKDPSNVVSNDTVTAPKNISAAKTPKAAMSTATTITAVPVPKNPNDSKSKAKKAPASKTATGPTPKKRKVHKISKDTTLTATITKPKSSKAASARTEIEKPAPKLEKPRKAASPTTASMINNALAAYAKLHKQDEE